MCSPASDRCHEATYTQAANFPATRELLSRRPPKRSLPTKPSWGAHTWERRCGSSPGRRRDRQGLVVSRSGPPRPSRLDAHRARAQTCYQRDPHRPVHRRAGGGTPPLQSPGPSTAIDCCEPQAGAQATSGAPDDRERSRPVVAPATLPGAHGRRGHNGNAPGARPQGSCVQLLGNSQAMTRLLALCSQPCLWRGGPA